MPLWDDATQAYTGQQPSQDGSSLWGWLTSLFSPRSPATPAAPALPSANLTPEQLRAAAGLPTWGGMSGVPASMQVAPPSMYTAANPQQQAAWQQASTPEGYAARLAAAPQGILPSAAVPAAPRAAPAVMMPPPPKPMPPPVIRGPLNIMPPAGGSTGWGGYGGMGILPPGYGPTAPPSLVEPSPTTSGIPLTDTKSRNLPDAELEKMSNVDIARVAGRSDLTYGDRMAILARLGR